MSLELRDDIRRRVCQNSGMGSAFTPVVGTEMMHPVRRPLPAECFDNTSPIVFLPSATTVVSRATLPGTATLPTTSPAAELGRRRGRREAEDAFDMPDDVFRQHFRPRKETVLWLCDDVTQELEGVRSTALSVERQVLCAVRWERGDDWRDGACGQQVRTTRGGGNRPRRDPQKVGPLPEDVGGKGSRERRFPSTRGIPGVIGCVDGSLIAIIAPKGDNKAAYKSEPAVTKKLEVLRLRDLSKKLRYRQKLVDQLWIRWKKKYLLELRALHIYPSHPSSCLQVDDAVLIEEPNMSRGIWPLGRVVDVFPGQDGIIRACRVKAQDGKFIRRPVQKLYKLELHNATGGREYVEKDE
ncbi:hypothetical protein HPB49_021650 [Dermacentor silvarum]|uniref:Uncharacterized protein n=1 Tax=Dermacentor silvarum TaxID=543639 RepID=A0ACB8D031_DERSI|nr:hypothetical protein HPB49_021650 [Dermacentor silvarum]